jgi:hypothetical protein
MSQYHFRRGSALAGADAGRSATANPVSRSVTFAVQASG